MKKIQILIMSLFSVFLCIITAHGQLVFQEIKAPNIKKIKGIVRKIENKGGYGDIIISAIIDKRGSDVDIKWNQDTMILLSGINNKIDKLNIGQRVIVKYVEGEQMEISGKENEKGLKSRMIHYRLAKEIATE